MTGNKLLLGPRRLRVIFFLMLTAYCLPLLEAAETSPQAKLLFKQADVVLEVIPLRVRPMERGVSVDAVENDPSRRALVEAVVSFKIRRVLKGEWRKEKLGGPTRLEQLKEALNEKNYKKILGLNLTDPNAEIPRKWLSIAVENPAKIFGINRWDAPEPIRLKVYFKSLKDHNDSFVMIGVVPS